MKREIKRVIRDIVINSLGASVLIPGKYRWLLLRMVGLKGISRSHISPRCFMGGKEIRIGENTFVNYGCFFDNAAPIDIGRSVRIGMNVTLVTGSHYVGLPRERAGETLTKGISIGDGAWIGANVTILPGVVIGEGAVIGAGSLVLQSIPPNELHAGNPAKLLRSLPLN